MSSIDSEIGKNNKQSTLTMHFQTAHIRIQNFAESLLNISIGTHY